MADLTCSNCQETFAAELEACPACGQLQNERPCDRHPERMAKGQCVICETSVCSECNQPQGRHFACAQHASIPLIMGWAQVYSALDDVEAELICDNLVAEGFDARVFTQRDHNTFVVDVGELDQIRVLVPAFEFADAVEVMAEHRDQRGEISFACPACGEAYEPGETQCAACGAALTPLSGPA